MTISTLKKLSLDELAKISGGLHISTFILSKRQAYVSLKQNINDYDSIVSFMVNSDDPKWKIKAAIKMLTTSWGIVKNEELIAEIDNWLDTPGFSMSYKEQVQQDYLMRLQERVTF